MRRCQCPQRASTHFFDNILEKVNKTSEVSMPSTGFYSFLLERKQMSLFLTMRVNALNGLLLISS